MQSQIEIIQRLDNIYNQLSVIEEKILRDLPKQKQVTQEQPTNENK